MEIRIKIYIKMEIRIGAMLPEFAPETFNLCFN
jgi:hypothetical protein